MVLIDDRRYAGYISAVMSLYWNEDCQSIIRRSYDGDIECMTEDDCLSYFAKKGLTPFQFSECVKYALLESHHLKCNDKDVLVRRAKVEADLLSVIGSATDKDGSGNKNRYHMSRNKKAIPCTYLQRHYEDAVPSPPSLLTSTSLSTVPVHGTITPSSGDLSDRINSDGTSMMVIISVLVDYGFTLPETQTMSPDVGLSYITSLSYHMGYCKVGDLSFDDWALRHSAYSYALGVLTYSALAISDSRNDKYSATVLKEEVDRANASTTGGFVDRAAFERGASEAYHTYMEHTQEVTSGRCVSTTMYNLPDTAWTKTVYYSLGMTNSILSSENSMKIMESGGCGVYHPPLTIDCSSE